MYVCNPLYRCSSWLSSMAEVEVPIESAEGGNEEGPPPPAGGGPQEEEEEEEETAFLPDVDTSDGNGITFVK